MTINPKTRAYLALAFSILATAIVFALFAMAIRVTFESTLSSSPGYPGRPGTQLATGSQSGRPVAGTSSQLADPSPSPEGIKALILRATYWMVDHPEVVAFLLGAILDLLRRLKNSDKPQSTLYTLRNFAALMARTSGRFQKGAAWLVSVLQSMAVQSDEALQIAKTPANPIPKVTPPTPEKDVSTPM